MPSVDTGYGVGGGLPWIDPSTSPTNGLPNAGAVVNPVNPIFSPITVNPAFNARASGVPSRDQFRQDILSSPEYRQEMQKLDTEMAIFQQQQAFDAAWAKKFFDQSIAQAQASGGGGGYSTGAGLAEAAAADKLQKEQAAHNLANQQEYAREALGSRGLSSSGQVSLEKAELQYTYDTLIKQIDLAAKAREAQAAQAASNAAAGAAASSRAASQRIDSLTLQYQYGVAKAGLDATLLAQDIAKRKGEAIFKVADYLEPMYFDPVTKDYVGRNGTRLTSAQAQATLPPATFVDQSYSPTLDAPGVNPIMYFK